jgi:hypothetical protein
MAATPARINRKSTHFLTESIERLASLLFHAFARVNAPMFKYARLTFKLVVDIIAIVDRVDALVDELSSISDTIK